MAEFPAMPLWTDAYLSDAGHLSTIEHGAYLLLLMTMWRAGGRLPNDDRKLARYARLTAGQWARMKPTIMEFFRASPDWITQGRLTDEIEVVRQKSRRQSHNARSRWLKTNDHDNATALPKASQTDAPTPTPLKEREANASPKKRGSRIPPDWGLTSKLRGFAVSEGMDDAEAERAAEQFRDYWQAKTGQGATKLDWDATWRNWVRNEVKRGRSKRSNGDDRLTRKMEMARSVRERRESAGGMDSGEGRSVPFALLPSRSAGSS